MTQEEIEQAADFAIGNKKAIRESSKAGCYYCKKVYNSSEVFDFLDQKETALCPRCGIDSVLPSNSPYKLTAKNLTELHKYWF